MEHLYTPLGHWPVMASLQKDNYKNICKIIIIGGGMAGLSAASLLVKNGITDFKILEATNKIGGRIEAGETGKQSSQDLDLFHFHFSE